LELPGGNFSFAACSVRALISMKAQ
jgi:hypothetical protein